MTTRESKQTTESNRALSRTVEWAIRRTGLQMPTPVFGPQPAEAAAPEPASSTGASGHELVIAWGIGTLATLALFYTLYAVRSVAVPIVISILLSFLLRGPVRALKRRGLSEPLAAAIVVLGLAAIAVLTITLLWAPVSDWVSRAPTTLAEVESKLRKLVAPLTRAAAKVEAITAGGGAAADPAASAPAALPVGGGFLMRAAGSVASLFMTGVSITFLTYFLVASGDLFLRKLMRVLPYTAGASGVPRKISEEIESAVGRYLRVSFMINVGVGLATAGVMKLVGMPNPIMFGVMAAMLNVVPYMGAVVTLGILGVAAITVFDSFGRAMLAPLGFLMLNIIEGNMVTPFLIGREFPLNTVALFIGVMVWGMIWGVVGAIIAVPLLVTLKIVADHVPALAPLGEFLGN